MWFFDTPGTPGGGSIVERIFSRSKQPLCLGYLWNDFEMSWISLSWGKFKITILIVKYFLSKMTIWGLRAWVSKNKQKILTWKRSSFVNMRVPWLSMCQSLRRTHDSWKNNKTKIINDKYVYVCIYNGTFMSNGRYELFELYYNSLLLQFYNFGSWSQSGMKNACFKEVIPRSHKQDVCWYSTGNLSTKVWRLTSYITTISLTPLPPGMSDECWVAKNKNVSKSRPSQNCLVNFCTSKFLKALKIKLFSIHIHSKKRVQLSEAQKFAREFSYGLNFRYFSLLYWCTIY